jgi:hypothetical protein
MSATLAPAVTTSRRDVLRRQLHADPNDAEAFRELVRLLTPLPESPTVPSGTAGTGLPRPPGPPGAPLRAAGDPGHGGAAGDNTSWSLAAELARSPRAWFPLIELARLGMVDDPDAAYRRLTEATCRDEQGNALVAALRLLRAAGRPDEAFRLALAHWRPGRHVPDSGRQFALAALDTGRERELAAHLDALGPRAGARHLTPVRALLLDHAPWDGPGTRTLRPRRRLATRIRRRLRRPR